MRAAFVVPRYGDDVIGGAESAVRGFAERLAARAGWSVEVFTSRAVDHLTWENVLPEGRSTSRGVTVHRFTCTGFRLGTDPQLVDRVVRRSPRTVSLAEGRRFLELQGPTSAELLDAVAASHADIVVFSPYLFWPIAHGVPRVARRAIMHPAAHDEAFFRLTAFDDAFRSAAGFVYYTPEERDLVEGIHRVAHRPSLVLGIGIDAPTADGCLPMELGGRPYLLYVGRVEEAKGCRMLHRYFEVYKQRHPGGLALVFCGPTARPDQLAHSDVVVTGVVDEPTKWALYRNTTAFVSPSPFESFSLVLMEAWRAGAPALVNGRCAVTRGHCARSGGGVWFTGYPSFESSVARLARDDGLGRVLGDRGRRYVEANYLWPELVERHASFLERMVVRASR